MWPIARKWMTLHENEKIEVLVLNPSPRRGVPNFDRGPITPELTRIHTCKYHLSIARVKLRLRVQFRVSGIKEEPPVFIFSVLRLIRSRAKLCTSSKRAWRFCTYSSGDEGVSEGDQTAGHKGDEDLGQKHLGW
ncbi:hypothetical protein TNCV_3273271 [Trichonephila clavipes]|nr:hypothetical protein TNCV_3273271 [Trichonephila clavipes]